MFREYNVYPKLQVYNVFNVAQTNLQEARPELYKKLEAAAGVNRPLNQTLARMPPSPFTCIIRCWNWSGASRKMTSKVAH